MASEPHNLSFDGDEVDALLAKLDKAPEYITGHAVSTFADLPDAASNSGLYAIVQTGSGVWLVNRKSAGVYRSDGTSWSYVGPVPSDDIPEDLSQLADDSTHRLVTDAEKSTWNGKSDFDGDYDSLTNKPTLGTAAATAATDYATAAQGALADSAVQPGEIGSAAQADAESFATAAQGALADSAIQAEDLGDAAGLDVGTTAGTVAEGDHNHSGVYSPVGHDHDADYAATGHNHDSDYIEQGDVTQIVEVSQATYDGLTPIATTLYLITS